MLHSISLLAHLWLCFQTAFANCIILAWYPHFTTLTQNKASESHGQYLTCTCLIWIFGSETQRCVFVIQSCPTLCDPMDCNPPVSSVHGILQANWLPCPPPGHLPDPGIEPASLISPALAGGFFTTMSPGKPRPFIDTSNIHVWKGTIISSPNSPFFLYELPFL